MEHNHIAWPSTGQFRNVIKDIRSNCDYHKLPYPKLQFVGTVKLHGTNHSVCREHDTGTMYTQSRERVTTPTSDNAGSSAWTWDNAALFAEVFDRISARVFDRAITRAGEVAQVYGEWCGGNVQRGVGIAQVPKMFVVFGIRVSNNSDSQIFFTQEQVQDVCEDLLTTVYDFPHYVLDIDFAQPEQAQNRLQEITLAVEQECPVARQLLGSSAAGPLVGEGVVWSTEWRDNTYRFKVKGEKHSSSKVKTLAAVDVEKVASIHQFVETVLTTSRLEQGLEQVGERVPENTGAFLKWVIGDVLKEEQDTLLASGLTAKDFTGAASRVARQWFLQG